MSDTKYAPLGKLSALQKLQVSPKIDAFR